MHIKLDSVLKNPGELTEQIAAGQHLRRTILSFALIVLLCGSAYGLTMGIAHSPGQAVSSALKVPALYLLTLLISIPTLHFIGLFLGSRIAFAQSLAILLMGVAVNAVLLLGFATISLFFYITGSSYRFLLLMHVAFFAISGAAGLISIRRAYRLVSEQTSSRFGLLQAWMVLYMFVGTQMAYVLGPFVGKEPEFYFFHHARGNFYSYVWHTIAERAEGRLTPDRAKDAAAETAAYVLSALKFNDYGRLAKVVHPVKGVRFILDGVPRSQFSAHVDPRFTAAELVDAWKKDAPVPVYESYNTETGQKDIRTTSFAELHKQTFPVDFTSAVAEARFNEFGYGREHKELLYGEFPGSVFVELAVPGERGELKILRLVFERIADREDRMPWRLTAVIRENRD